MNTLDSILSTGGESAPAEQTTEENNVTQQTAGEAEGQTEQAATEADTEGESEQQGGMVPRQALDKEKHKVRRYTEEVAEFRRTIEAQQRQIGELMQRIPVPKQEQQAPPDWYENPNGAMDHHLVQRLGPIFDQFEQRLHTFARENANHSFGADKVADAEKAFLSAVQAGQVDQADYQKVVGSPNRWAAAYQWHQRQIAAREIGDDPAAYRAKVEAELRDKIMAEMNGGNGQQQAHQSPAAVMPSNLAAARNVGSRSGPAWAGPPSLRDILSR